MASYRRRQGVPTGAKVAIGAALVLGATHTPAAVRAVATSHTAGPSHAAAVAIRFARAQEGKPYVYGAAGPDSFDCSGLVQQAYAAAGIPIPRTSEQQWAVLPHIPPSQAKRGDLVFFTGSPIDPPPGHVGLVAGPGMMIDALETGTPVQEQPFSAAGTPTGFARAGA